MEQIQTSSHSIQEDLKAQGVLESRLKCESTFDITHLCIDPKCSENSFHCRQQFCPCCFGLHQRCEIIQLLDIKQLLEARVSEEKRILGMLEDIARNKFEEIWQEEQSHAAQFFCEGLQNEQADVLRKIYSREEAFKLRGTAARALFLKLQSSISIDEKEEQTLLAEFEQQMSKIGVAVMELQRKMMSKYKSLKMKQESLKAELQLKASFNAKARSILKDSRLIDKNNEEKMRFIYEALGKPLQLELIYRASEHNFMAGKFHQLCDGISNTFTVIKTQFGKTIAGYTPLAWNSAPSGTHAMDPSLSSFLLLLDEQIIMTLIKPEYAIYCYTGFGPRFGGGADIHISDQCDENRDSYCNFPSSYGCEQMKKGSQQVTTRFCGATKGNSFRVKEYEVFRVYY